MKTALSIAGSDSCGGAGIQADIKTMTANKVYAMTVITSLTAQNTLGVSDIFSVTPKFLSEQLNQIFSDIFPDAVKIGMVPSGELALTIAEKLKQYGAKNIVADPVMVATSGSVLSDTDAISVLKKYLFPFVSLITPNIPEAEILSGMKISSREDMEHAAQIISESCLCSVLCKGGHSISDADDVLYDGKKFTWFYGKRINNPNTHGTGCTLSSAIASNLAKGYTLCDSIERAKNFISCALSSMLNLGQCSGPLDHMFDISGEFAK